MPELSIVIPTLARSASLTVVLDALSKQDHLPHDLEVIVALDAAVPKDTSIEASRVAEVNPKVIRASRAGASGARNAGWSVATGTVILFLDDDIVPTPRLLRQHMAWHDHYPDPEVAVLGLVRWSPQVKVTPFMRWLEKGIQFDYGTIRATQVNWTRFYSCNISVKRSILERVGGFDELQFPYGYEDLDLGRRLADYGLRLLFNPAAEGHHLKTETLDGWRRNLRRIAVAERRFTQLYPGQPAYFHDLFKSAANAPPTRGRAARLARLVSPTVPWLGRRVWRSYDLICRQSLAGEFLTAWDSVDDAADGRNLPFGREAGDELCRPPGERTR